MQIELVVQPIILSLGKSIVSKDDGTYRDYFESDEQDWKERCSQGYQPGCWASTSQLSASLKRGKAVVFEIPQGLG